MRTKTMVFRLTLAMCSLSLSTSKLAASSFEVVIGRYYLTQSNLPYAHTSFSNASDSEGKVLKALTSLALLQQETNAVSLVTRMHYISPANPWQLQTLGYQKSSTRPSPYRTTSGVRGSELVSLLRNVHMPIFSQAESDLASFTDNSQLVPLGRSETGNPDIYLDRGDILMIRSLLACGRFLARFANSQNIDVLINDYILLEEEPGPVTIEKILARFPDLAKLALSSDLPLSRSEAKNAIQLYKQASEWIRNSRPLGVVRLFNLPGSFGVKAGEIYTSSLADEAKFRAKLDEYAALMDGPTGITGFDNGSLDTFNGKMFFDGMLDLRSKIPLIRKNKVRQGSIMDATFGGIYPGNTVLSSESYLWTQTLSNSGDQYAFGLFIPPALEVFSPNSASENQPVLTFDFHREGDPSEEIFIALNYGGTSHLGFDFQNPLSSILFGKGVTTLSTALFSITNDSLPEFHETIIVSGTTSSETEAVFTTFTLTILDDDGTGVGIFATDNQGKEGRIDPDPFGFRYGTYNPIRFEVRRTGSTSTSLGVKVNRNLLLSSATPDDYQIMGFDVDGQTVRIPAGQSSAQLVVNPKYDLNYPEGTESLALQISADPSYALTADSSASASILDSSLYEWWSYQSGLLVTNHPPGLDVDSDGMPNLLEMALGRDPNLPDSSEAIQDGRDAEGYLTLTFKRWSGGVSSSDNSYSQYGVLYRPQATSSLENPSTWTSSSLEIRSVVDTGDGMELVTVRDTLSKTQPSRFLRVLITLQE